jgi:hypothetical protein
VILSFFVLLDLGLLILIPINSNNSFVRATSNWTQSSKNDFINGTFNDTVINTINENLELYNTNMYKWSFQSPTLKPWARYDHSLSEIYGTDKILLFGGYNGTKPHWNETWIYDLSDKKWTKKSPDINPGSLEQHAMAPIWGEDKVLLFGGVNFSQLSRDTWIYDFSENTWTKLNSIIKPSARQLHKMVSIQGTNKVLLFGGLSNNVDLNDTWIFDFNKNNWEEKILLNNPGPRRNHAMASVFGTDKVILFGGYNQGLNNETWIYDYSDNNWMEKNFTKSSLKPTGRIYSALASIYGTDRIILHGGLTSTGNTNDTWIYDFGNNTWTDIKLTINPGVRYAHALVTVFGTSNLILFGGISQSVGISNETWILDTKEFNKNGTYTSIPKYIGPNSIFKFIYWNGTESLNTRIKFQIRTANTNLNLNSIIFVGPNGTNNTFYNSSNHRIWYGHNGNSWIQYKVFMSSKNTYETPKLKNVTIIYNYWPNTTLIEPKNGSINNVNNLRFLWNFTDSDSYNQTAYQLIIDDNITFTNIKYNSGKINSTNNFTLFSDVMNKDFLSEGTWYWKVRTKDNDGDWGHYSKPWKLVIDTIAPNSKINFPVNNTYYNCVDSIYGTANESVNGTGLNNVEISIHRVDDDTYFDGLSWIGTETWLQTDGTSNWTYNSSVITWFSGWEYNIRSRAIDVPLNVETPKPGNTFIYDLDHVMFSKAFPYVSESFNTTKIEVGITITDDLSGVNASSIEYTISKDHGATWKPWEPVYGYENGNTIDVKLDVQFWNCTGNQLKWRAHDLAGNGPTESKVYTINIINQSWLPNESFFPQVQLLSPANNSKIRSGFLDLIWTRENSDNNDVTYNVYFDDEYPPQNIIEQDYTDTKLIVDELKNGITYFWTVIPKLNNTNGTCISGIWSFTLDIPLPKAILKTPENNSEITSSLPTLVWSLNYDGTETVIYDVYFGTNKDPPLKHEKISTTYFGINNALKDNTTYFWYVVPWVGEYEGLSSEIWSFTIKLKDEQIPNFGIELDLNPNPLEIKPGEVKFVSAIVTNLGEQKDNFTVVIGDINNTKIKAENYRQNTLEIEPGKNKEFLIMISVEDNTKLGFENITITATSKLAEKYDLDVKDSQILTIKILEKDEQKGKERGQPISIFYFSILLLIIILIIISIIILIIVRKKSSKKTTESELTQDFQPKTSPKSITTPEPGQLIEPVPVVTQQQDETLEE